MKKHHEQRLEEIRTAPEPLSDPKPATPLPATPYPGDPPKPRLLFLYRQDAMITLDDLNSLRAVGFVPIRCADLNAVKIIDPLTDGMDHNMVLSSALQAINQHNGMEGPRTLFGKIMLGKLLALPK